MTFDEAASHSPAQLTIMTKAASRIEAGRGLLRLHSTYAAMIALQVKEGRAVLEKLQKQLAKQATAV